MNEHKNTDSRSPRVLLGVSGSIAIVKSLDVVRRLRAAGCEVRVAMTSGAQRMIAPVTFEALTEHSVYADIWDAPDAWRMDHLEWAKWADLFLIAPASANLLAGLAVGTSDNAVTSTALAWQGPLLLAPAMNPAMYAHPATQANVALLVERGAELLGPTQGLTLCGDEGEGRMVEPEAIVAAVMARVGDAAAVEASAESGGPAFRNSATNHGLPSMGGDAPTTPTNGQRKSGALTGKRVLITAGATREPIDPVRYITNGSSGKTGIALALEAVARGAKVDLVLGPTHVAVSKIPGVRVVPAVTAREMADATLAAAPDADVCIFTAAVADYTPTTTADRKLKKGTDDLSKIELKRTIDIAASVGEMDVEGQLRVGFAAETNDVLANARDKLARKNLHLICANDVTIEDAGFGADQNAVVIVRRDQTQVELGMQPKEQLAARILDVIEDELATVRVS